VAKGARRPKSPFAGKLDLFYAADLTFRQSQRSELHQLREVKVWKTHPPLRSDLQRLQLACYFAQLLEQSTEINTPLPGLFPLFEHALEALVQLPIDPVLVHSFEMKLLAELGLSPELSDTKLSPGSRQILERITTADWAMIPRIKLSSAQAEELEIFLRGFLTYHLGGVPKSRSLALPGTHGTAHLLGQPPPSGRQSG